MVGYIYITENLINGKKYIGKKKSALFLGEKYLGSGKLLNKAITKYGKENFKVTLLEEVEGYATILDEREIFWIKEFNAVQSNEFYNLTPGGTGGATYGNLGHKFTEEQRKKLSEIQKQRYKENSNLKKNLSERNKKRFENIEERRKISEKITQLWENPEYAQHMKNAHKGKPSGRKGKRHSEETKLKISKAGKGRVSSRKGVKLSEQQKKRHSEAIKGRHFWNNGKETRLVRECPGIGWVRGKLPCNGGPDRDPITGKFQRRK